MKNCGYMMPDGSYFEAHYKGETPPTIADGRVMVPLRPNEFCAWDGSTWVEDAAKKSKDKADKDAAKAKYDADTALWADRKAALMVLTDKQFADLLKLI